MSNDPFADFDETRTEQAVVKPVVQTQSTNQNSSGGNFADEILSKKIEARNRTFFIDLKQSTHGKFLKISERSRGKKSTIIMDAEDIPAFTEALEAVKEAL
jgi:hypothetical protein